MIEKEQLDKIKKRLKEIKSIRDLSSRDFRFKNWHASTINLLKILPSDFIIDVNDFKKLTFTDTKYHRGNRIFNPEDDTRYREDLDSAVKILKKITTMKEGPEPKKEIKAIKKKSTKIKPSKKAKIKKSIPAKKGKSTTRKKPAAKTKTKKSKSIPKKPPALKTKKIKKK